MNLFEADRNSSINDPQRGGTHPAAFSSSTAPAGGNEHEPHKGGGDPGGASAAAPATNPSSEAGAEAPDFKIEKLDGPAFSLALQRGHVVVLEFGSLSSPSFRERAAAMETLRRSEELKATFLVIYTREAHPVGGWELERNKAANIAVDEPTDVAGRRALAKRAKDLLGITIPIAIDGMDDAVSKAYNGFPNSAVVIGRDGRIVGRQKWTDASGLKRMIDEAAAVANAPANPHK